MILQASERFKALQYFVNCFGIPSDPAPSLELDTAGFKEVITTIVRGTWLCLRAQVRLALRQDQYPLEPSSSRASIVNVASTLGFATEASMVAQAAGNHGILGMTRSTALDFIDSGIRINCVCPGATDTAFLKSTALLESQRKTAPTNVLIKPDEVAQAIVFLLGPGASAINAVSIPVDRGWSLFHH
jgi:NAD(P)-dependent dehydrogenase (short-subunit alcohol dehydrogenase family)